MTRRSVVALSVVAALALAACGGGDDDADTAETSEATSSLPTVPVPEPTSPPTTSPETSTTTSTSTTTTTTTSTTTTTPTTVPEVTPCIEGSWWLSPEATSNLYGNLLPGMPVSVTGTHWAEFNGGAVDYWAILEVRFAVGGTDVTFGLDQHGVGTYAVEGDVLTMNYDTFESTTHEGHGEAITNPDLHPDTYANDAVALVDNGDGTITIDSVTVPVMEIPPVAGGPMGCDGDTMSLGFTSGLVDTVAVFARMR